SYIDLPMYVLLDYHHHLCLVGPLSQCLSVSRSPPHRSPSSTPIRPILDADSPHSASCCIVLLYSFLSSPSPPLGSPSKAERER
ncbi:MAG: hypothetical protein ACK56I_34670, partial [bacterium]